MHEYYHSTTVKYSESAPKWVLPIWPPRPTSGFNFRAAQALDALQSHIDQWAKRAMCPEVCVMRGTPQLLELF